jgi:hypothetical protein
MKLADGSVKCIHATAVDALIGKGLLQLHPELQVFTPSGDGFLIADDRLRKSSVIPQNFSKKDSSTFVG